MKHRSPIRILFGLLLLAVGAGFALLAWSGFVPSTEGDPTAVEASLLTGTSPSTTDPPIVSTPAPLPDVPAATPLWSPNPLPAGPPTADRNPTRLEIEKLDVDAPIVALGVDRATGEMEVPSNVSEVAWYEYGPSPGEQGSAVLAAHVDLRGQGPGVFYELGELRTGDVITVSFGEEPARRFVVEARSVYDKDDLPLEAIFSRNGPPTLTLITCGGGFDSSSRQYDSNVVVYAVPEVPDAQRGPD
jgi:LPXTG-site transpeptidase (sortase) family protein